MRIFDLKGLCWELDGSDSDKIDYGDGGVRVVVIMAGLLILVVESTYNCKSM